MEEKVACYEGMILLMWIGEHSDGDTPWLVFESASGSWHSEGPFADT